MNYRIRFICAAAIAVIAAAPAAARQDRDVTIRDVFQYVYKYNPRLISARRGHEAALQLAPQARAGWRPTLEAESSIFATDVDTTNFGAGDGAVTKDITVTVDQPVFRGGRTFAEVARAQELIKASRARLDGEAQAVFLDTATAYARVIRDRDLLSLAEESERVLQEELAAAEQRFALGDVTRTDVLQARARLARAQSGKAQARGRLGESEARFEEMTGYVAPPRLVAPALPFSFPETGPAMALQAERAHPEVLAAMHEREAAERDIDTNRGKLYPHLSAFASYNKQFDPQPGIVDESEVKTVGLRASLSLYEGGAQRAHIREAKAVERRRAADVEEIRRRLRREVGGHRDALEAARAESALRAMEIEAKTGALDGVREEVRLGQRTVLDILDAHAELLDAREALVRARYDETVARFALAADMGMLTPGAVGVE